MGRAPCCDKNGLKKGPWTPEEDQKLIDYIHKHGYGNWRTLPKNAGNYLIIILNPIINVYIYMHTHHALYSNSSFFNFLLN